MIDAERLLGNMMRSGLRGRKKKGRGIGSSALAAGAMPILAGVAFAAAEHFMQSRKGGQGAGGGAQRPGSDAAAPRRRPAGRSPVPSPARRCARRPLPGAPGPDAGMAQPGRRPAADPGRAGAGPRSSRCPNPTPGARTRRCCWFGS